ncbi:MAG: Cysteine desulfurase [Frankiales bacterium]|nr:Cysteine desulfurase [Frankiales bacterium]
MTDQVLRVDSLGRSCPQPVIDLAKAIRTVSVGAVVEVLADDPVAAVDIPAWCWSQGHEYLGEQAADIGVRYRVRRGGGPESDDRVEQV